MNESGLPPHVMAMLSRMRQADAGPPVPVPEAALQLRAAVTAWEVRHEFQPGDLVRHKPAVLKPSTVTMRGCPSGIFYVIAVRPEARPETSKKGHVTTWHDVELAFLDSDGDLARTTSDTRFLEPIPAEELEKAPTVEGEKPHRGQITNWFRELLPGGGYVVCGRFSSDGEHHRTAPVLSMNRTPHQMNAEIETAEDRYTLIGPDLGAAVPDGAAV